MLNERKQPDRNPVVADGFTCSECETFRAFADLVSFDNTGKRCRWCDREAAEARAEREAQLRNRSGHE